MTPLCAGDMDRRIIIQTITKSTSAAGQREQTAYANVATVWAQWVPTEIAQVIAAGGEVEKQTGTLRIRYFAGVTPQMIVEFLGVKWDILSVESPDRNVSLTLVVEADRVPSV